MTRCRHNPPCQRREYWGRGGAGVLFTCSEDGTVLLLLRAAWVEQGGTWGIPGGGIGEGFYRTPMQPLTDMRVFRKKAEEEVEEECGALPPYMTRLPEGLPFTEYEDCGFRYVTFILDITRAQKATWAPFSDDGENDAFVWFPLDAVKKGRPLPDENGDLHDIHFGVTFTMGKLPTANPRRRNPEPTSTDVNSAAFKRWFGASKVVDAQGRPRVVYHGTAYAPGHPYITEFRGPHQPLRYPSFPGGRGKFTGVGSFFSESEEVAASYPYVSLPQTQNYTRVVHALYLRIEKPKVYRTLRAASEDMVARAGPDPVAFVALLRAEGYDGITFMEGPSYNPTDAKKKARVWITFSPEQVRYVHPPKAAPLPVVEDDEDDDWDDDLVGNPRRATTAERTDPALWEAVKREVTAGSKGGVRGEWSARKAQLAVAIYKKRGGDYIGPKSPRNALAKWTREDWRTRSGEPSLVTGERYLPARAIEALTPAEYAATSRAKRAGLLRDEQFTAQPERIREKTARYRRNPALPTARYDALAEALRDVYFTLTRRLLENRTLGRGDVLAEWADANGVEYLGSGWHRMVFRVPEGALKISVQHIDRDREDGNLSEARVWREAPPTIRKHLVPVLAVAEDGTWLLQEYAPSTGRPQTAKEEKRVDARLKALSRCGFNWREISGKNAADDGRVLDYASVQDDARWQKCVEKAAAKKANPARRARGAQPERIREKTARYRKNPDYKHALIRTLREHGARLYTYDTLPSPAKAAATEYLEEPRESDYLVGELPTEYVKQRIVSEWSEPFAWPSFDAYHRWYVEKNEQEGRMPDYPLKGRWPSLLAGRDKEGFLWDGWHRFHAYVRSGHPTVPVYMLVSKNDAEVLRRANPARRARGAQPERIREKTARYRRNPDPLFPEWFKGSVVVMPDGTPRTLWHQTSREAEASILKSGFSVGKVGRWASSKSDTEMPYGVFLKTSPARVWSGLPTGTQMAVVVHAQNPLRVADRAALKLWLHSSPAYRALEDELAAANAGYRAHDGESLRKRQSAWSEWNKTFKRLVPLMRQASTDALVASGHDALWMDNDEGPTSLETLVVLDPRDVRLVSAPDVPIGASRSRKKNPSPREAEAMRAIRVNLTPDLLAGEYRACATSGPMASSPVAGHCAVATEALYFMLGGKAAGYTPMNVRHEGVSHWYLRTPDGRYLDPTADQFDTPVDYASGRGRGFPTPRQGRAEPPPSKRAAVLLSRIR